MSKSSSTALHLTASPVYLAASAVNNLITGLPAGTAYFIGIVLVTMFTGQLVQHQGSLARAALPYVMHLRWGSHRTHRAMQRGLNLTHGSREPGKTLREPPSQSI